MPVRREAANSPGSSTDEGPGAGVPPDQQWVTAREKPIDDEPVFFTFTL